MEIETVMFGGRRRPWVSGEVSRLAGVATLIRPAAQFHLWKQRKKGVLLFSFLFVNHAWKSLAPDL
jgi:hypothetical protein